MAHIVDLRLEVSLSYKIFIFIYLHLFLAGVVHHKVELRRQVVLGHLVPRELYVNKFQSEYHSSNFQDKF